MVEVLETEINKRKKSFKIFEKIFCGLKILITFATAYRNRETK